MQKLNSVYLSVILPAYKEAKRIPKTLLALDHYLSKQSYLYEILVVNDGSPDNTAEVVGKFTGLVNHLRLIDNKENHGKGYVVRQGMLEAKGEIRLFMDADGSTAIDNVEKMFPLFESADVVISSRDSKDAKGASQAVKQSFLRRTLGNMGNLLIQIVAVPGIWDTQNGFKAFTAKAAEDIFSRARINRWGFDIEALALARHLHYRVAIIPVHWKNDLNSTVGWKAYLQTFKELFIVRVNLWRNVYAIGKSPKPQHKEQEEMKKSSSPLFLLSQKSERETGLLPQKGEQQEVPAVLPAPKKRTAAKPKVQKARGTQKD